MKKSPFSISASFFLPLLATLSISATGLRADQTFTWMGSGTASAPGDGNWNSASSWLENAVPAVGTSGGAKTFIFRGSGSSAYTSNDNVASSLTGNDSGKMIVNQLILESSSTLTQTIQGSGLTFSYTAPTITQNGSGDFDIKNSYVFAVSTKVLGTGTGTLTFSGVAGGGGTTSGGNVTIDTAATVRFANNSNLLASVTLNNGTLDFTANGALRSYGSTSLNINGGTFLSSNGSTMTNTGAGTNPGRTMQINAAFTLAGTQNWSTGTMAVNLNTDAAITANAGGTTGTTIGGVIADGTDGSKLTIGSESTGTLTLTGNNTYTGGTLISAGTLLVNNTEGSGTGTGDVAVGAAARLGGTGTISGNTAVAAGGLLDGSSGALSVIGDLTIGSNDADAAFRFDFDTAYTLSLGGDFLKAEGDTFYIDFSGNGIVGDSYTLLTFAGITDFASSDFAALGGNQGVFTIQDGSLRFTVIPEPSQMAFLGMGILAVGFVVRRRSAFRQGSLHDNSLGGLAGR